MSRSGIVASRMSRRTSGVRLIARKSRTLRDVLVERARSKAARIDLDARIAAGVDHCRLETRALIRLRPTLELNVGQLDPCELAVVSHPQIAFDAERAQRGFGTLDALEPDDGDRR